MKNKIIIAFLFYALSSQSYSGFKKLTWHSRANCGNNESITWQAGRTWDMRTVSFHYHGFDEHVVDSGYQVTWRSAAVHWGEAVPGSGYQVIGNHYVKLSGTKYRILRTNVTNCSIYDGWWD